MEIIKLSESHFSFAIDIFAEAFTDDPLFIMAFHEEEARKRCTKIMYEFVVNEMVTKLELELYGAFEGSDLLGCLIYTTPQSKHWSDDMIASVEVMRGKANDKRINLIGEYAMLEGFEPGVECFYGNELAVRKEFRHRGIGTALCNLMINECKKSEYAGGIVIDTANVNNLKLYEKLGWKLMRTVDFYDIKKYFLWRENNK